MGFLLGELLKSLCVEIGWSYAVFWRAVGLEEEEMYLIWEDGYCGRMHGGISGFEAMDLLIKEKGILGRSREDRMFKLVHKRMGSQVHVVGDGVVGKAASTGNHRWILRGNVDQNCLGSKGLIEINQQFLAGIQTIAVIPVIPQGVLQLGSTQLISEEIGFVNYVQNLFMQSGSMTGKHLCDASGTILFNKFQLSASMQRSINQFSGCHDSRFSTKTSSVFTNRMLPSTSHVVNPNSNGSLFPGYLKSHENQFRTHHGTTHGSADNQEVMVDNSKLLHLKTHESELSNTLDCSKSASKFGRSSLYIKAENIENSCSLSSGIIGCIKSQISMNSETSQIQSLTNDLDRVLMRSRDFSRTQSATVSALGKEKDGNRISQDLDGPMTESGSCVSGGRLDHSYNKDGWYDLFDSKILPSSSLKTAFHQSQQHSESILFDLFDLDQASNANYSVLDDSFVNLNSDKVCELITDASTCIRQIDADTFGDISNNEISFSGELFSESGSDQLLDAIVSQMKPTRKLISADNVSCKTASTETSNISFNNSSAQCNLVALSEKLPGNFVGQSTISTKSQIAGTNSFKSECSVNRSEGLCFLGDENFKSQISLWVGKARNMNSDGMSTVNCGRIDEAGKLNKKRSRAGENPRPRPKDRQMIQDRVKELREIVPNGAKMSIDALLEKTIKHMLFLESVTKHADKLRETGKPKIISEDEGLLLKDNLDGGATWAFEFGTQSVICPIIVEDLSPRHMLVEMLCEKKGLFLEIADLIRGLGLTILKGVMEARDDKVWARFAVEANKDVTRMDVFLSLVHLLEPAAGNTVLEGIHHCKKPHNCFNQSSIPVTGATDCL